MQSQMLEFFPVKLIGGFIAVDHHVGCAGCRFCLSRRHHVWENLFSQGLHLDPKHLAPEDVRRILDGMKSFHRAGVPVRFGHNTDAHYQWTFGENLYRLLPETHPFIMLTRYSPGKSRLRLFQGQSNLLLKLTITPPSRQLGVRSDIEGLLETVWAIPPENLYVLVGPVAKDSLAAVTPIVDRLPAGTWMDIKAVTVSGIPGMEERFRPPASTIDALRKYAAGRGLMVTDYFGCVIRRRLQRPFYKAVGSPAYMLETCSRCVNTDLCHTHVDTSTLDRRVRKEASAIGLSLCGAIREGEKFIYASDVPTARGDETYLSERVGRTVRFAATPKGSRGGCFSQEAMAVFRRWEETGMFPLSEVWDHTEKIWAEVEQ